MGAYLSSPIRSKESECGGNEKLSYGASAMQGWRMQQEDAHNCIVSFDEDCSLFAVYDGHGGHEVSQYAAKTFPEFLKSVEMWSKGRYGQALEDAFLKFDELLIDSNVVQELEIIAGLERDKKEDEDDEDKARLFEEANLPLEEVLSRYGITVRFSDEKEDENENEKDQNDLDGDKKQFSTRRLKIPLTKRKFFKHLTESSETDGENPENGAEMAENPANAVEVTENSAKPENARKREKTAKNSKNFTRLNAEFFDEQKAALIQILGGVKRASDGQMKEKNCDGNEKTALNVQDGPPLPKRNKKLSAENFVQDCSEKIESLPEINGACPKNPENLADNDDSEPNRAEDVANVAKKPEMTSPLNAIGQKLTNGQSEECKNGEVCEEKDESNNVTFNSANETVHHHVDGVESKLSDDVKNIANGKKLKNKNFEEEKDGNDEEDEEEDEEYAGEEEEKDDSSTEDEDSEEGEEQTDENEESDGEEMMEDECLESEEESFPVPPTDTPGVSSGTTACVALVKGATLYVANAGDSRCVLCRAGRAVDLSDDHKPEDPTEQARIERAGGRISEDGRVNGGLNLSRALGDHFYKTTTDLPLKDQMITALPDIRVEKLLPEDRFLVLACDGIWNSMSSQSVVEFVNSRLEKDMDPAKICEEMCDDCLAESTAGDGTGCDNMTVIIVDLKKPHKCNKIDDDSEKINQSHTSTEDQGQPDGEDQPEKQLDTTMVVAVESTEQNRATTRIGSVSTASQ